MCAPIAPPVTPQTRHTVGQRRGYASAAFFLSPSPELELESELEPDPESDDEDESELPLSFVAAFDLRPWSAE